MTPPHGGTMHKMRQQEKLRNACKTGDLSEVALALKPKASLWWKYAKRLFSYLSASNMGHGFDEPADLGWAHDDDLGNMPIHYIALGSKPSLTSAVMVLFCIKPAAALSTDMKRAELLRWLIDNHPAIDLSAVNAHLQTPVHSALQSHSLEVLEVLLTYAPASGAQRQPASITSQDCDDTRPLDVALSTQQWPAVRLLISAGALQASPELTHAQRELQQLLLLPDGRRQSGALLLLKGALGRAVGLVWRQGDSQNRHLSSEPDPKASGSRGRSGYLAGSLDGRDEDASESRVVVLGSPQEIYQHRHASIQGLARTAGTGEYSAQRILEAHQWNLSAAHRLHTDTLSGVVHSTTSQGDEAKAGDMGAEPVCVLRPCSVCFEEIPSLTASIPCEHHTCDECVKGILLASMDDGDLDRCVCPVPECKTRMPEEAAEQLLSRKQLERYQHLAAHTYANRNPTMQWCPRPGCGSCVALDVPPEDSRAAASCRRQAVDVQCSCGERFCLSCGMPPHEPAPCAAVRDWNEMLREAKQAAANQSESWMTKNTKPCNDCGAPIQKSGGCNHITCSQCHGHFCWVCGRSWKEHSSATGGYYSCNRFVPSASGDAAEPSGIRSFLSSLYGKVQDAAQQYRLEHYLRRYHAQECDAKLLHLSAGWMTALLSSGVPATGCQTAAVGLKQLLQPAESAHLRHDGWTASSASHLEDDYNYLSQAAAEVVSGRKVLANSYIAAYAMPWTDRKRQFEETQGRLEAAVEQCSLPLALVPQIEAVSEATAQQGKAKGSDALLKGGLNKLPLDISDGALIRQQMYHALAVHSMAEQIRSLTRAVVTEKNLLLQMAREGYHH